MRLWVDDLRPPPMGWLWAKSLERAFGCLEAFPVDVVSLDHDLGGDETTRPLVLHWCETDTWPKEVRVHSANPVGREWLEGMIKRYKPT